MFNLNDIVRPNILALKPYSSARDEFKGKEGIFLDANENPYGELNRYPDPYQSQLKSQLSNLKGIGCNQIFVGNGSDEVIDLAYRIFCTPGQDKALTFSPTYGMYEVSAGINNVELIQLPLDEVFQIDLPLVKPYLKDDSIKLIFICSPNNPTGNSINADTIQYILENFKGIVIIDEAYIDFSDQASWIAQLEKYPNLIISQTLSKAWGLASLRVGIAYSSKEIIQFYNKVKPPYNISLPNQTIAYNNINQLSRYQNNVNNINTEKSILKNELKQLNFVKQIYPSDANFFLIEVTDANRIYNTLIDEKIIIRNRNSVVKNCVRITVGSPEENQQLITALKSLQV
jgi:histidinol-phosphate aminotransferase